ncbi:alpha-amylase family protein [Paraburkholderia phenoliruptrix]|uniref:alpha-amylase family protein n=1 Tax=Paraburkholderia phenoliruptrix TaxID=252970 RepID=UPI0039B3C1A4
MADQPWYKTTRRWGQTNLVEIDPTRYDAEWWRQHWRRTEIQGVIVNGGGIVAYYPSEFPLHRRAETLGNRDLFGEIVSAAREQGLAVIARMDSNRVAEEFYGEHPDWICVDRDGKPYRLSDKYVTCINSPYYSEYLPQIIEEIIQRYKPDGLADNSWAGLPREHICYCRYCRAGYSKFSGGRTLPLAANWDDEGYRLWIRWNYERRTELWRENNLTTIRSGGADCLWNGMLSGNLLVNSQRFNDLRSILAEAKIVMLDHQHRTPLDSFEQNTEAGKRLHELGGWDKLIPESMPQYMVGVPTFRLAAMPKDETRLWSFSAFAGGIQPWWHHIGAAHDDRRQYTTAEPVLRWYAENEDVLLNRAPQADVGVVWSHENHDLYGRDNAQDRTMQPYRGVIKALEAAALTYLPIHLDDIANASGRLRTLVLPNVAVMSQAHVDALNSFVQNGGSLIATGDTSLMDEHGEAREDFGLSGLFGVHRMDGHEGAMEKADPFYEVSGRHTYLRLSPELRAFHYGPADATAPTERSVRHPILAGLDETDILPFGGYLPLTSVEDDVTVLATFIPAFPIYPPETSWMRTPVTKVPAVSVREHPSGGKLIWLMGDLDRCFSRDEQPDHGVLLGNALKWSLRGPSTVEIEHGHGFVSPTLFVQGNRQILHLINRLEVSKIPGRHGGSIPIGPLLIRLKAPLVNDCAQYKVMLRVAGGGIEARRESGYLVFELNRLLEHEVVVVDWA